MDSTNRLQYPVVYWPLSETSVCGHVLGTPHEVVRPTRAKAAALLKQELKHTFKVVPPWENTDPAITDPTHVTVPVTVRPTYRSEGSTFPVPSVIEIPLSAVYGKNAHEAYTCFLPLLRQDFLVYDPNQVEEMATYFARNFFKDRTPEQVYDYVMPQPLTLDTLSVRSSKAPRERASSDESSVDRLKNIAERHPLSGARRRSIRTLSHPAWERGDEVNEIRRMLDDEGSNVLVVGPPGAGKSAVLRAAIQRMHSTSQTAGSSRTHFWKTTPNRMTSGAKYLGDWQKQCSQVIEEVDEAGDVLWLDAFPTLFQVGGESVEDSMAAFLEPHVARGALQIVGEVREQELEVVRRHVPDFVERFRVYHLDPMPRARVLRVLEAFADYVASNLDVAIDRPALETTYRLLRRHEPYASFPGKAVRFLKRCVHDAQRDQAREVTEEAVMDAFVQKSGLPELLLRDDVTLDSEEVRHYFSDHILGQEEAIAQIAQIVTVFKAGLNDPNAPVATLLFVGPTGVGKTETVRTLANFFFGAGQTSNPLIRLDMSEFQHPVQVRRLIGTKKDTGRLIQQVREKPFSVILLDEIEKAHPIFFDTLLSVLDEGLFFDAMGRATDFRNTIIVMTSNVGTRHGSSIGFGEEAATTHLPNVRNFFRPEFVNRLDQVVPFQPLDPDAVKQIALKELQALNERMGLRDKNLRLTFDDSLVEYVATEGFNAQYGARPVQRLIEQEVVGDLATTLLDHPAWTDTVLHGTYRNGTIHFRRRAAA